MSTVYVYGYDTSQLKLDLQEIGISTISSQSSSEFVIKGVGLFLSDTLTFIGNFTTSNGTITGGTITELQVSHASGSILSAGLELDIPGLTIPVSSDGFDLSFNLSTLLTSGSTYYEKSTGSYIVGLGNDTFYGGYGTYITPGGGFNTIYANGTGEQINLQGSSATDTFIFSSNGSLTIIDSSSTTSAADTITGSVKLFFEGNDTFVQDNNGVLTLTETAAAAAKAVTGSVSELITVSDSAANVAANLDALQALYAAGRLTGISLTDSTVPALLVTAAQYTADAGALQSITSGYDLEVGGLTAAAAIKLAASGTTAELFVSDSAANVMASLDSLLTLTDQGILGGISLTDGGIPVLTVTPTQSVADHNALINITGNFALSVTAGSASETIDGVANHAMTVVFSGAESQYTISTTGGLTVTDGSATYQLSNVTALQFSDVTDIVASHTPAATGGISSYQVATLYAAVLARTPDPAGLAYYENYAANNTNVPFTTYAEWFLQSPEYTASHNYAQTSAGDSQFITDTYQNLLHRAPEAGAVPYYLNVITTMLQNVTSGTAAYTAAELAAHAQVLAYISQSPEFQGDVQVTAQNPSSAQHWLILL